MYTILVIDDHLPNLVSLCTILNAEGYMAVPAENAAKAELFFRRSSIDLVILDHVLPGISGTVLSRTFDEIRHVPVLMMSGNPDLLKKPASVDLLLPKPTSVDDLLAAIELLIAGDHNRLPLST